MRVLERTSIEADGMFEDKRGGFAICSYFTSHASCTGVIIINNVATGVTFAGFIAPGDDCVLKIMLLILYSTTILVTLPLVHWEVSELFFIQVHQATNIAHVMKEVISQATKTITWVLGDSSQLQR